MTAVAKGDARVSSEHLSGVKSNWILWKTEAIERNQILEGSLFQVLSCTMVVSVWRTWLEWTDMTLSTNCQWLLDCSPCPLCPIHIPEAEGLIDAFFESFGRLYGSDSQRFNFL